MVLGAGRISLFLKGCRDQVVWRRGEEVGGRVTKPGPSDIGCGEGGRVAVDQVFAGRQMNPPDYPMVIVAWHDAHAETTWCRLDEIDPDPYVVHTVGWLLPE